MDLTTVVKWLGVCLLLLVSFLINPTDSLLARMGIEFDFVPAIAVCGLVALMLLNAYRAMPITLAIGFCFLANLPADFVLNFGFDRDLYFGLAAAMVMAPVASYVVD